MLGLCKFSELYQAYHIIVISSNIMITISMNKHFVYKFSNRTGLFLFFQLNCFKIKTTIQNTRRSNLKINTHVTYVPNLGDDLVFLFIVRHQPVYGLVAFMEIKSYFMH